jgi:hypothetical protein
LRRIIDINIGILHYHWLRCGVYTVVNNNLKALIAYGGYPSLHIDLISRDDAGQALVEELELWAEQYGREDVTIRQIEIAGLDYHTEPASGQEAFVARAERLVEKILNGLTLTDCSEDWPYILNPHNINLGKNPGVTLAIKLLSDRIEGENLPIRLLYQMHDFAEDHRPQCWTALRHCRGEDDKDFAVEMMYPPYRCIDWVTINSTDKTKLESIGLNPHHIFTLPNSVEIDTFTQPSLLQPSNDMAEKIREHIATFAQENGFLFDPHRKILLSPIKVIRRKNVIESILLLLKLNAERDCYQLLLTLNAHSETDIAYSQAIVDCVKQQGLPVTIGYGHQLAGPTARIIDGQVKAYGLIDLMALSDAIITTSIQEGFGYVFHEAWLTGKAVLGRNIKMVTSDFIEQGMQLDHLYEHLLIPQRWLGDQWEAMVDSYIRKISQLREEAGLDAIESDQLSLVIRQAKQFQQRDGQEAMIDFADCDQHMQLHIIQGVISGALDVGEVVAVDKSLQPQRHWYQPDDSDRIVHNRQVVINRYGLKAQAKQLEQLLEKNSTPVDPNSPVVKKCNNQPVFERALAPENSRLLI